MSEEPTRKEESSPVRTGETARQLIRRAKQAPFGNGGMIPGLPFQGRETCQLLMPLRGCLDKG